MTLQKETLVPLDESDLIAHCERQEQKIAALTTELGTVKEVLRQLNDRDKRLREALEKPHRDCDPLRIING